MNFISFSFLTVLTKISTQHIQPKLKKKSKEKLHYHSIDINVKTKQTKLQFGHVFLGDETAKPIKQIGDHCKCQEKDHF